MTIKDYASQNRLAEFTIRRRIKAGALSAELLDGKWYIERYRFAQFHLDYLNERLVLGAVCIAQSSR